MEMIKWHGRWRWFATAMYSTSMSNKSGLVVHPRHHINPKSRSVRSTTSNQIVYNSYFSEWTFINMKIFSINPHRISSSTCLLLNIQRPPPTLPKRSDLLYVWRAPSYLITSHRHTQSFCATGSIFQIVSAYSSIHRSLLKNPIRLTLVIHLVTHSSWFLYASSTSACVVIYELKSSETR